jgi:hypothetical protein
MGADADRRQEFLKDAAERSATKPVQLSIRKLLGYWGAMRRGYLVVSTIERELAAHGLRTQPSFTIDWIDTKVALVPLEDEKASAGETVGVLESEGAPEALSLTIGSLEAANARVQGVRKEDSLELAQTLMMRYDFSQLAVMRSVRDIEGAVSWESIAVARLRKPDACLTDCLVMPAMAARDDDLLRWIPHIADQGFVFVRAKGEAPPGIVTAADLSQQFADLASPFLRLGEIERRLRRAIGPKMTRDQLQEASDPADGKPVESVEDLTLGGIVRFIEKPDNWDRIGWPVERPEFVKALDEVRIIRNDVMHFSPDPLDEMQELALHRFLKWLRILDP